ncbi:MAG: CheB methylesterase domain-containing protein, partial [Halieaceae bacterium]|nr:CheB methylesterase domain-containing protein [Halieaceae bacterium]
ISTGGPQALTELLPKLPSGLPPILIVQHMPGPFITALAEKLDTQCELTVREAQHEMPLERGYVYIAPGGWQMSVQRRGAGLVATLHDAPAENHCLPAADYLFRGAVEALGKRVLGIVMTGMGNDGAQGLLGIKQAGGIGIAQNETSCTVFGMPKQAIKVGGAHFSLALDEIADAIKALAP